MSNDDVDNDAKILKNWKDFQYQHKFNILFITASFFLLSFVTHCVDSCALSVHIFPYVM